MVALPSVLKDHELEISMKLNDIGQRVTAQRFTIIDTGRGTIVVIPLCSNPQCNKPLKQFEQGLWASLQDRDDFALIELRSFCRRRECDIFKDIEKESHYTLISSWWALDQLWQSDQRSPLERIA